MSDDPSPRENVQGIFEEVRRNALPSIWSAGVAFLREGEVRQGMVSEDEVELLLQRPRDPISVRVSLYPIEEGWTSDCSCREDPCVHVVSAVLALKNNVVTKDGSSSEDPVILRYRFELSTPESLMLRRELLNDSLVLPLQTTLKEYVGGVQSGRTLGPRVLTTREDFLIDELIEGHTVPKRSALNRTVELLAGRDGVFFGETPVTVRSEPVSIEAEIVDENDGVRLRHTYSVGGARPFRNGAVLSEDALYPLRERELSTWSRELLNPPGRFYPPSALGNLVTAILPKLEKELPVRIRSKRLPRASRVLPEIVLTLEELHGDLVVTPHLVYGDPPLLEVVGHQATVRSDAGAVERDFARERELIQKLQKELDLRVGQPQWFRGDEAIRVANQPLPFRTDGAGRSHFAVKGSITPRIELRGSAIEVEADAAGKAIPFAELAKAYRENRDFIHVPDKGWFDVPREWLAANLDILNNLLAAREPNGTLPASFTPTLSLLQEALSDEAKEAVKNLLATLGSEEPPLAESEIESSMDALREYQRHGVRWLRTRGHLGIGALLADDMGLGKTVQALFALKGRSLVVAPTSVLTAWGEQIQRFRPSLSFNLYHAAGRGLTDDDVTITSYAILRRDLSLLKQQAWETIVLDESQNIKNADTQSAQAAFALKGSRRIALTGTPIENRLENLWSQFHFLNRGLLGSYEWFQERFAKPAGRDELEIDESAREQQQLLKRIVQPFILRRTKDEVAPELPARTEVVLRVEFRPDERDVYDTLLATARKEVKAVLANHGSVLSAFERLLRLRQACCHPGLVPGQRDAGDSSKVELLTECLNTCVAEGHKSLVFSQWTSFLDKIEESLRAEGHRWGRLDGSTVDRGSVVEEFQREDGPPILLLSLKAGGVGLTLTAADQVFMLDPWWNPAVERQAADRAHRIGQTKPVFIHRLIVSDTVEEKILGLQRSKEQLARSVISGEPLEGALTTEDLITLLDL